ncbi:RimJ/RimL family protein N-acetyltransferase [Novosphingobium kunmingense]|uniref:RimJ/RimL family protein N-acetyltransferase n=1 Tax=Novosphingobium kunmingense TaxID=1211806 RepID=A0A2N0H589_9SPHN|nr:GNAT family N-acetyltransferase [Novosphingobium kunmingense]PKB14083.1 RimJ/RimL family protein N-acetyltransferase [Novosphingobium kunmingense]
MSARPILSTDRFDLWQPQVGDHRGVAAMLDDPETTRHLGAMAATHSDAFARLLRNAGSWALYGYGTFIVRSKGDERIVGSCGVFRSFRGFGAEVGMDDVPEAGWILHRELWGKGAAQEVMRAVLGWFEEVHGQQRIACMISEGNDASVRVAQALGFVPCGTHVPEGQHGTLLLFERSTL